jgi:serine/threonine protein kinase
MTGRNISHYEILEKLGEGGMGVVYKARDTHLDRFVAIKVLSANAVSNPERKRRFVQEAKSASALNHPNIITVYDISNEGDIAFIAMEYVEGKTLDQLMGRRSLRLSDTLKYAVQITDALATAHAAGIVHRDIKPANIMVTEKGLIKVLDFGLAKLTERGLSEGNETAATATVGMTQSPNTEEGTIVGTVAYMSPEQAQGKAIDARSDIFSFGAVLYEMTTGRRAFSSDTKMSILAAILNKEPKPAHEIAPDLPREVERVIDLCLRKEPARRFQHMEDLRVALAALQEESDSGKLEVAAPTHSSRWRRRLAVAAVVAVALGVGWAWISFRRSSAPIAPALKVVPLTTYPGSERHPSFSPDGNQVAFSWNGEKQDNFDIYVKLVSGGTPLRLTTNPAPDTAPSWSPDGLQIAFIRNAGAGGAIYLTSPLGGSERKLTDAKGPFLAWVPDGKSLVMEDRIAGQEASSLFVVPVATGEKRLIPPPGDAAYFGDNFGNGHSFDVSPDGTSLAFARRLSAGISELYTSPMSKWAPRRITMDNALIAGLAWTADGREVVFSSTRRGARGLWRIPADARQGTEPGLLSAAGNDASFPAISRAGPAKPARLVYERRVLNANIWRAETSGRGSSPIQIIASTGVQASPQLSPDGKRIVFSSDRAGNQEIWMSDGAGSNAVQLTSLGTYCGSPRWAPDSQHIAFDGRAAGKADIYVVSVDGGAPRRLTIDTSENARPSWSRDGKWIYFRSDRSGSRQIWKMPALGGSAVQITRRGGFEGFESSDGKVLYYVKSGTSRGLWSVPSGGGEELLFLDSVWQSYWSVADKGIYFIDFGESSVLNAPAPVRFFDFETRQVRQVATIAKNVVRNTPGLFVSRDGRQILWAQIDRADSDLMLVENFR